MKLTIEHLLDLIDALPKNTDLEYVKKGKSKAQLVSVDKSAVRVELSRHNEDNTYSSASLTTENLAELVKNIKETEPFRVDDIFRGGGNTRSTYESIIAHTSEFYKCSVGPNKHLVWLPDTPHEAGKIVMYDRGYSKMTLEERIEMFKTYLYSEGVLDTKSAQDKYWNHCEGPYKNRLDFVWEQIKSITEGKSEELCDLVDIDLAQKLYDDVTGSLNEQNKAVQNRLPSAIIKKYIDFLNSLAKFKLGQISTSISPVYRPYITAIKSKPFLLLAGISGTGKSRIVRELARACWDIDSEEYNSQKPRNFEMVQVKPNWHDSSELIGYVSRVSGDPVFVVGDFLKFVAKAWEEPEVPYFLCLDEMNLAPVEQYFAEYLSVVESRKADGDGIIKTDPILRKEAEQWYFDLVGKLTQDPDIQDQFKNDGICLPQNLVVIGTVNMDETTFSFSRKVLDRAMTIEMNEVDLEGGLTNRYERIGKLSSAELIGSAVEGVDIYSQNKEVCDVVISYLKEVNSKLEGTPFKIAYRTRNEFLLYVVNNLPYTKDADSKDVKIEFVIARALDEITTMKILSRIEGDETKVSSQFLELLEETIKKGLENVYDGTFGSKESEGVNKSTSLAKLEEMKTRLSSGYTSFWS